MLTRPRLKAHYRVEILDGQQVFLLAEGKHFLLDNPAVATLLPLLDGRRTVAEIVAEVAGTVEPQSAFAALQTLAAGGHLAEGDGRVAGGGSPVGAGTADDAVADRAAASPESADDGRLAWWDLQGLDPAAAGGNRVRLVTVGSGADPVADQVADGLCAAGVAVEPVSIDQVVRTPSGALPVVLTDDYAAGGLDRLNSALLAAEQPWLLARPTGRELWLGPLLTPGATGCWACIEQRLTGNRQVERYLTGRRGRTGTADAGSPAAHRTTAGHPTTAWHPAGLQMFGGLLAGELTRYLGTGATARLDGSLLTIDTKTLQVAEHTLVAQPQCPRCGDPSLVTQRTGKVVLSSRPANCTTDGGYRVQPPQQTYDRLSQHISPILGAVTTLSAHESGADNITYSFTAGHNFAMVNDNIDLLRRNLRGQSGGKGRTEIQAKVSAICEAIERYCAVWRPEEPVVHAAYRDLEPGTVVHPSDMLLFSPAQLQQAAQWNADPAHRLHLIPEPFDETLPIDWSRAWSLTADAERLVPAGIAWYGHPDLARHFYCVGDSNGSAAGNTLEEAVLQGFCEVVERDAVALWWYNRIPRRGFDLDNPGSTVGPADVDYIRVLQDFYAGMDRDLWVLDITSDLGIPTFVAGSRRDHAVQDVMVGFGAHPDPRTALMRALTELNQFLPFVDQRDADGNTIYRTDDPETLDWCRQVRVADEPWLLPDPEQRPATLDDFAAPGGTDLADLVQHCVSAAATAGIEVIALDQSRPDIELSVVKVIAPGLRHFWRRLGPGRLYDVPVRMGWLPAPTEESDLNPRSVFF